MHTPEAGCFGPQVPPSPMKQMLVEQAVPQLDMIVQVFDAQSDAQDPKQERVRKAAMEFRDALKEWAS